jgi:hypothetical protein
MQLLGATALGGCLLGACASISGLTGGSDPIAGPDASAVADASEAGSLRDGASVTVPDGGTDPNNDSGTDGGSGADDSGPPKSGHGDAANGTPCTVSIECVEWCCCGAQGIPSVCNQRSTCTESTPNQCL